MSVEEKSLSSFRCLLFFFFAGVGCLLPFMSLHLKSLNLSADEIKIISYVSPLFSTIGPVLLGPLVDFLCGRRKRNEIKKLYVSKSDKNVYVKSVLSATILLSAIFYCLLLSVPTVENDNPRKQQAVFVCNEHGASLVQEKCNEFNCFKFPNEMTGMVNLENCKFNCTVPQHFGYITTQNENAEVERKTFSTLPSVTTTAMTTPLQPRILRPEIDISNLDDFFGAEPNDDYDEGEIGSGEDADFNWNKNNHRRNAREDSGLSLEEFPHICHDKIGGEVSRSCFVFTPNTVGFNVNVIVKPFHEDDNHCTYPLGEKFSCRIPRELEKPNESCKVVCDLRTDITSKNALFKSQCGQILSDPSVTFWTYLTFRSFGDLFFSASVAILIGAVLVAAGEEIGREFILPSLSYGLLATVIGYLHSDDLSPLQLEHVPNFSLGILGYGFFSVIALFILIFTTNLSIGPPDWWRNTRNTEFKHKKEFFALLFVLILMGILWGPIYFHVPWQISQSGGLELYVGCAAAVGALFSVPLVWKAFKIVDFCGYSNILIGAFTIYILRYTGLLFIENPWVLSIIGAMEAITLCLMLFSAVFYVRHLVPKRLTFMSQSLVVAAHFCIGGGLGCLISTLLSPYDLELELFSRNVTEITSDVETPDSEAITQPTYHFIYCCGAVASAVIAFIYFLAYHCCLKKRCLAPLYRNDQNGALPIDSGENGMYTPLRVIRNGRQSRNENQP